MGKSQLMAVSVQTPLYSKPGMWNLGDPPSTFPTESDGIPVSMAYHYPASGLDSSSMIPTYHHPPLEQAQPHSPAQTKPASPGGKHRGTSSGSKSAKIKRSMSTPNVRGQSTAEAAALALSADKRRNKLGYHRTSVACGHCRRRKIRCIPAPADPTNRCSNCIRLKKECSFFPVDQQPPLEPKRRGSKAQSGTGRASESSSPSTTSGQLPELPSTLPFPNHLNMPPIQDLGGPHMKRQRTESFSPENKVVTSSRTFEYNHGTTNWMAPDASPNTKTPADVPHSFWRVNPQDSPLTPAFSPFTPTSLQIPPPQNWPNPHTEASPREDLSWSVPQRSISYSNLEGLNNQHHYTQYSHPPSNTAGDNYTTKPRVLHSMYPPPISTTGTTIPPSDSPATSNDTSQHPQSAGALPSFPAWQQPYSYQKPATSGGEHYGSWNASHGGQLPLPVETAHSGPPAYGYGDPPSGMYYPAPPQHGR